MDCVATVSFVLKHTTVVG